MGNSYKELLEKAKREEKIVVTGPQRSGTTFTSYILAKDLGYELIDEMSYGVENKEAWEKIIKTKTKFIVQCPARCKDCSELGEDVLVVMMIRPIEEIIASQNRIGWGEERIELNRYGTNGIISQVKYDYWKNNKPPKYFELDYNSLRENRFWVNKDKRKEFKPKQIAL